MGLFKTNQRTAKYLAKAIAKAKAKAEKKAKKAIQNGDCDEGSKFAIAMVVAELADHVSGLKSELEEKLAGLVKARVSSEQQAKIWLDDNAKVFGKVITKTKAATEEKSKSSEQRVAEIKSDYEDSISNFEESADETTKIIKAAAQAKRSFYNKSITEIKTHAEETIANLKASLEEWILKFQVEAEDGARSDLQGQTRIESQTKAIAEEKVNVYEEQLAKIKSDYEKSVVKIKASSDDNITKVKTDAHDFYNKSLADIRLQTEETIAKAKDALEERLIQVQAEAHEAMANEKIRSEARVERIAKSIREEFAAKEANLRGQILAAKSEAAYTIAKEKARAEEMAEMALNTKTAMEEKSKAYEEHAAKLKVEAIDREIFFHKLITKIKTQAGEAISETKNKSREFISSTKADFEESISYETPRQNESYIEIIAALKADAEEKARFYQEQITKIKQELGMKMVRTKIESNRAIVEEQIRIKELEKQIVGLSNKIKGNTIHRPCAGENPTYGGEKINKSMAEIKKFAENVSYTKADLIENPTTTTSSIP